MTSAQLKTMLGDFEPHGRHISNVTCPSENDNNRELISAIGYNSPESFFKEKAATPEPKSTATYNVEQ